MAEADKVLMEMRQQNDAKDKTIIAMRSQLDELMQSHLEL